MLHHCLCCTEDPSVKTQNGWWTTDRWSSLSGTTVLCTQTRDVLCKELGRALTHEYHLLTLVCTLPYQA